MERENIGGDSDPIKQTIVKYKQELRERVEEAMEEKTVRVCQRAIWSEVHHKAHLDTSSRINEMLEAEIGWIHPHDFNSSPRIHRGISYLEYHRLNRP